MRRTASITALTLGLGIVLFAPAGLGAQEDHPLAGSWEGQLELNGGYSLTLVYHFEVDEDGALTGTWDSPDQGAVGLPYSSVTFENDTLTAASSVPGNPTIKGALSEDGTTLNVIFTQGTGSVPLVLTKRVGDVAGPARPQEPKEPFPYRVEDVHFVNDEAGVELAGTLTMPEGDGPFPAAVLVTGSGPEDRDETVFGHKPFWVLADHLTRNGVAVLRHDDRGYGESTGDFATATSEDFASDALAGVAYLRGVVGIDPDRIGIIGHSEGGLVGPIAANRSGEVAYVVMLAGPGVTGLEVLLEQGRIIREAAGVPPAVIELNENIVEALAAVAGREPDPVVAAPLMREALLAQIDALPPALRDPVRQAFSAGLIEQTVLEMNSPWMRFFLSHDPRPALEALRVPVLAITGDKDLQVWHEQNMPEIEAALARGGNPDATIRTLAGLNHLFQQSATGNPTEYYTIEETFNAEALEIVSSWILERFGS